MTTPLDLINPFSSDFVWWQVARKTGAALTAPPAASSPLSASVAPDMTFWVALLATAGGGIYLYKRSTKRKRK